MNAADIADYLDDVARDESIQLSSTGRRALRDAAGYISWLSHQAGFKSELPAYRRVLKAAVREWRRCGNDGRHPDHQAGRVSGLVMAIAELRGIDDEAAKDLIRQHLTCVDTPAEHVIS